MRILKEENEYPHSEINLVCPSYILPAATTLSESVVSVTLFWSLSVSPGRLRVQKRVVWSFEPDTRTWPTGCQSSDQTWLSWAVSFEERCSGELLMGQ